MPVQNDGFPAPLPDAEDIPDPQPSPGINPYTPGVTPTVDEASEDWQDEVTEPLDGSPQGVPAETD